MDLIYIVLSVAKPSASIPEGAIKYDINHEAVGRRLHLVSGATTLWFRIRAKFHARPYLRVTSRQAVFFVAFRTYVVLSLASSKYPFIIPGPIMASKNIEDQHYCLGIWLSFGL